MKLLLIILHMLANETFALVVMTTMVLTTIALIASYSQPLFQMDVKNVFLYEDKKKSLQASSTWTFFVLE